MARDRLKGLDKMFRSLDRVSGASKKAAKAGVKAGLTSLARTIKKAIDASDADPNVKRIAKQTIGNRLKTQAGGDAVGKAGFGVGKKSKKIRGQRAADATDRAGDKTQPGVGVSASNIHWFVRGAPKGAGERKKDSGDPTGRMEPTLDDVIDTAISVGAAPALAAAAAKSKQVLAREAAKVK
jgi:hypothetical protein